MGSQPWFVIAGVSGERNFYSRTQCRGQGLVTVVGNVPTAQTDTLWFLFVALSNSLSVKPNLNLAAKPAPHLVFPAAAPGYASSAGPPASSPSASFSSAPTTNLPGVDRSGKTNAIRLALADGTELKARDVFERVSEAVFVVEAADRQGSAVAISDRELVTNCHVLGAQADAIIEREGQRMSAKLSSANGDADRCILTSDTPLRKWVRVRPYADIKVGERAFTVGAPQGLELTIAEGIVSSKRVMDGSRLLQTSAPISKGSSGGGLFDAQGYLLGVTTWMRKDSQNLNFAIAAEEYAK
jgi:S1-C subfamily serine protease